MIPLPQPPKVIEKKGNYAKFEIEGFYPGYGITLGNSLRRVLLSSIQGAAVTKAKIKGVQHEFSTIPGISEDVINILLNLKKLRFKMYSDEPQKATLYIKGEKEVKASDFEFPSQVELVSKDFHIASLTEKKAELEMEIEIAKGIGFEPLERRQTKEKLEIGTILLDAFFSPIQKVSIKVESMRVGERTDFDRLIMEVETDGTIQPEEALMRASETLSSQIAVVSEIFKKEEESPKEEKTVVAKETDEKDVKEQKVSELKISSRIANILEENSIKTVAGLIRKSESDLLGVEGLGEKAVQEIKKALKKAGASLKEDNE